MKTPIYTPIGSGLAPDFSLHARKGPPIGSGLAPDFSLHAKCTLKTTTKQELQQLTMRIVAKCLFNIDLGLRNSDLGQAFTDIRENQPKLLETILKLRIDLPFTDYGRRQRGKRVIDNVIYQLIAQRRKDGNDEGDFLSMLLATTEDNRGLSDTQIRDHIMTFIAAGHETSSNTLAGTFYLLAQNNSEYEKLYHELQRTPKISSPGPTFPSVPDHACALVCPLRS